MILVGCDYHSRYPADCMRGHGNGDLIEGRLEHENGDAQAFYSSLRHQFVWVLRRRAACSVCSYAQPARATNWLSETPERSGQCLYGDRRQIRGMQATCWSS
jgi:hypothetical protein